MLVTNNVVQINENNLYQDILAFINEQRSENTKLAYSKNIREFAKEFFNKDLEYLTIDDLKKVKKKDLINYRQMLKDKYNFTNKTLNHKMSTIKMLFQFLSAEYDLNVNIFNFKRLPEEHNQYGELSQTEAERFAEMAYLTEREKPYLKKMLIMFAIRTSFRLNEILNIRWSDFEYSEKDNAYVVTTKIGKGNKKNDNSIAVSFYNQLLELKEINKRYKWDGDPDLVFQISEKSVHEMMTRLKEKMNIPKERNIVFHSFRGIAIDWALEMTGDIRLAAQQGNHSNINTTYKHYVKKTKDYSKLPGVLMDEKPDLSFMDNLTLDDFKEFVKNSDYRIQHALKQFYEKKKIMLYEHCNNRLINLK